MPTKAPRVTQCQKPSGLFGQFVLWNMNSRHSGVTDWGLSHVSIHQSDVILDVGCGGGRTVNKLATIAGDGKVCGIDYSQASVAFARKVNRQLIEHGRVAISEGSASQMPYPDNTFDLVTAVETHFWWPDIMAGMREIRRVLKPGGTLVIVGEVYKGADTRMARMVEKYLPLTGMKFLTADEHRALFVDSDFSNIQIDTQTSKGWICCTGRKSGN